LDEGSSAVGSEAAIDPNQRRRSGFKLLNRLLRKLFLSETKSTFLNAKSGRFWAMAQERPFAFVGAPQSPTGRQNLGFNEASQSRARFRRRVLPVAVRSFTMRIHKIGNLETL
jgi:hypothetical protein